MVTGMVSHFAGMKASPEGVAAYLASNADKL
jgi:hypothetical protein